MNKKYISSIEINQIFSQFKFLFYLKYKNDIISNQQSESTSFTSLYQTNFNSSSLKGTEYIISGKNKYIIEKDSEFYYMSESHISKQDIIQSFYTSFIILYQNLSNKKIIIKNRKMYCETILNILSNFKQNQKEILIFLKNLWILLTENEMTINQIANELIERFELSLIGISKRNYNIENFSLHKEVFEGNLRNITKLLSNNYNGCDNIYNDINEPDPNNNTPLLLALKKNNSDVVQVLCDYGADYNLKIYDNSISPIEYALKKKNIKMLKILVNSKKKQKLFEWERNKDIIFELIKKIPNCIMNLKLNFDSNLLNIFSSLTACDYYKISKLDGNIKIDMNISSSENGDDFKGKTTILVKEEDKKIYKIDNINKITYDYIEHLLSDKDEEKKVEKLLKDGIVKTKIFMNDFGLYGSCNNKNQSNQKILNYQCDLYKVRGCVYIQKDKIKFNDLNFEEEKNSKLTNSFEEYFYNEIPKLKKLVFKKLKNQLSIKSILSKKTIEEDNIEHQIMNTEYDNSNSSLDNSSFRDKNTNIKKKQIDMSCWLSKDFPLTLQHFIPLIHILSFSSSQFSELENAISKRFLPFKSFPLKISFPLGLSFHALLSISSFSLKNPKKNEFDIPYQNIINNDEINKLNHQYFLTSSNFYEDYYKEKNINNKKNFDDDDEDETLIRDYYSRRTPKANSKIINNINDKNNFELNFHRKPRKILKDISNDEGSFNYNNIPITPKKRNKKNLIPDLERQNTIKCITKLKISPLAFNNQNKDIRRLRTFNKFDIKPISAREKSNENIKENNSICMIM